jgi:Cu+-exporting ATPase
MSEGGSAFQEAAMTISTANIDPVCGDPVTPDSAAARREYEGETFYMCSATCAVKFDENPQQYAEAPVPE